MKTLYFTPKGAERLMARKAELADRLRDVQYRKGQSAEGGSTWHDNFEFEELVRQERMLNDQIRKENSKISRMVVLHELPIVDRLLRIGLVANLLIGERPARVLVGGCEDFDSNTDPQTVSYLAPIVSPFMGEPAGTVRQIEIDGRIQEVMLEFIEPNLP